MMTHTGTHEKGKENNGRWTLERLEHERACRCVI